MSQRIAQRDSGPEVGNPGGDIWCFFGKLVESLAYEFKLILDRRTKHRVRFVVIERAVDYKDSDSIGRIGLPISPNILIMASPHISLFRASSSGETFTAGH